MVTEAKIKEIFDSIQGEGSVIGYRQLFIRFCGCNLSCDYCDTDFGVNSALTLTSDALIDRITNEYNLNEFHSISLTGGEPLLSVDFLEEFLEQFKKLDTKTKVYLETNATLTEQFLKIKKYIDIVAADIKLESSTGKDTLALHEKFLKNCNGVQTFAKIVFDENITQSEIEKTAKIAKKYSIPLILQPKMVSDRMAVSSEFCEKITSRFISLYHDVRLIPQVHKFLNVR